MTTHTLVLLRHASALPHATGGDRARPLGAAGRAQARALGRTLAGDLGRIEWAVCSDAVRTVETLRALAESLEVLHSRTDDALYLCDARDVLDTARAFDEDTRVALVVGHEPSISTAARLLGMPGDTLRALADGVPTATAVIARFEGLWSDLPEGGCRLEVRHQPVRP